MQASAARALDLMDPNRLAILLHADDPVVFASSHGEMCRVLSIVAAWSWLHGAQFHVGQEKSVVYLLGGRDSEMPPIYMQVQPSVWSRLFVCDGPHKWLGWWCDLDGGSNATLLQRCGASAGHAAVLSGLVAAKAIPLPLAMILFEGKVDGSLAPRRWLYAALADNAEELLDGTWKAGCVLLLAPPHGFLGSQCGGNWGDLFLEWRWP